MVTSHYFNTLNDIKHACVKLGRFCSNLFTDLDGIVKDPTVKFWYGEGFTYNFNKSEVQGSCKLYDVIEYFYKN